MISHSKKTILQLLTIPRVLTPRAPDEKPTRKSLPLPVIPLRPYVVQNVVKKAENDFGKLLSELS